MRITYQPSDTCLVVQLTIHVYRLIVGSDIDSVNSTLSVAKLKYVCTVFRLWTLTRNLYKYKQMCITIKQITIINYCNNVIGLEAVI